MQPKEYLATEHDIDSKLVDADALFVIRRLHEAGFDAYLVGGGVRDLLVKTRPKDFDISTSARPEQVKQIFQRQCILIGRRFRLAHIRFGKKIIEVATFRSGEDQENLIVQDNEWGSAEEDALRRDFTINGLFYDAASHKVIDYVGGWQDIHNRLLRTIGDPVKRFKQDPVRMIRMVKFCARFGFSVDPATELALHQCKNELTKSSTARVLEEIFRMLESGSAARFFQLMTDYGLMQILFDKLTTFLSSKEGKLSYNFLSCADKVCTAYGPAALNRAVLVSCLLFPLLEREIKIQYLNKKMVPHLGNIIMLASSVIKEYILSSFPHFPRRINSIVCFILTTQYRLTPLTHKRHYSLKLLNNKDFILALKFLKLRSLVHPRLVNDYETWKKFYRQEHHSDRKPHPKHPRTIVGSH